MARVEIKPANYRETRKALLWFCVVLISYLSYYIISYWHDVAMDFAPLYVVGKMFLARQWDCFYDFRFEPHLLSFRLETGDRFIDCARLSGFPLDKHVVPLYIYSPTFIPLFALVAVIPFAIADKMVMALNCLAVVLAIWLIIRLTFPAKHQVMAFLLLSYALLFTDPIDWSIKTGQITPWLLLLTWFAWKWAEDGRDVLAGIALGTAFWLKFFPALLVLLWLRYKKIRPVFVFMATIVVLFASGIILFGPAVFQAYLTVLQGFGLGTPIFPVNQSVESVLMRWWLPIRESASVDSYYIVPAVKLIALAIKALMLMVLAAMLLYGPNKLGQKLQAFGIIGICGYLLTIAWNHYTIFSLPLLFLLMSYYWSARNQGGMTVFVVLCLLFVFGFSHANIVRLLTDSVISLIGKDMGEIFAKFLLSRHLIAVVVFFALGVVTFFKTGRQLPGDKLG